MSVLDQKNEEQSGVGFRMILDNAVIFALGAVDAVAITAVLMAAIDPLPNL